MTIEEINLLQFDNLLNTGKKFIVKYYIPGCKPCQLFNKIFEEKVDKDIIIYSLNYAENLDDLFDLYHIQVTKFPTIEIIHSYDFDENRFEYSNEINAEFICDKINKLFN